MAKQSGIGANLYVAEYDVSGDIGAVNSLVTSRNPLNVTSIDQSAMDRLLGQRDGSMAFTAFWDIAAGASHPVLSALPRTDRIITCLIGTTAVGSPAASMVGKQITYGPNRGQDGSLIANITAQSNGYGLEWGESLTVGKQSFATGTVNGTSINFGDVSSAFGASAYLHVFSVASGTATFTVQDSDDDATFAAITGLGFTAATGATSERKQTAVDATIRQYVRVQGTGTHGAAVIALVFVRYLESTAS